MSALAPGWVDAIASAVKTGDEGVRSEALGMKPRHRFRIDPARLAASAAKGGRKAKGRPRKDSRND